MRIAQVLPAADPRSIDLAWQVLQAGQLVAFPTDTVYGLAAALTNPTAIQSLYNVKGREPEKPIAILVGSPDQLYLVAGQLSETAQLLAQVFWPGPLTLVVNAHESLPAELSPLPTIGVRMPDHPHALALLNLTGPLAVTSANRSGSPNATTAQQVFDQLAERIPLILDGGITPGGLPSTVIDCTHQDIQVLRPGPINLEMIEAAIAKKPGDSFS